MRQTLRGRLRAACLMTTLSAACAHSPPAATTDPPQCSSPQAQRLLTYCVSPAAAEQARQTDVMRQDLASIQGSVNPKVFPLPVSTSPTLGPADAAVTLVIFSDLECPYCAQAHQELEALQRRFPKDVRLVFKHFPLSFHPNAKPAARAAQAAHAQGKFWEFVSRAYAKQDELSAQAYLDIAQELSLDMAAFKAALDAEPTAAQVNEDLGLAKALYVQATPTIFLNGVALPGAVPADQLAPVIEQQRRIVEAFAASGVPKEELYWRMVRAQYQPLERPEPEPPQVVSYVPTLDSATKGASAEQALVTITIFSDFECPYCKDATPPLEAAVKQRPDQVRLVFKHFPLPFHERADEAAALALLAQRQGKFWEAHDLLFMAQEDLSDARLLQIAQQLGLPDKDPLQALRAPALQALVQRDMATGLKAGVEGTPTFYINGKQFVGAMDEDELEAQIAAQVALAQALKAKGGVSGEALYEALVKANEEAALKAAQDDED